MSVTRNSELRERTEDVRAKAELFELYCGCGSITEFFLCKHYRKFSPWKVLETEWRAAARTCPQQSRYVILRNSRPGVLWHIFNPVTFPATYWEVLSFYSSGEYCAPSTIPIYSQLFPTIPFIHCLPPIPHCFDLYISHHTVCE
jgi:hypothetical protein